MMNRIAVISAIFVAFVVVFGSQTAVTAQNRYAGSYAKGVELFYAKDYAGAAREFEKAEAQDPANHAAYLWHGLAFTALGDLDSRAANIWLKMPWDVEAKTMTRYFMGLGYWQRGETSNAKYWLKETFAYKETRAYPLAQSALASVLDEGQAPPIEQWPALASLPGARGTQAGPVKTEPTATEPPNTNAAGGAKPGSGLWKGTISNGYKGQTISFRVSADGKTMSDILFQGYLICRGSRIENTGLAPLESVDIASGAFASTQLNGGAMVRFDLAGSFTSSSTASGTYRVQSSTDCDTYELKWTASRVGR